MTSSECGQYSHFCAPKKSQRAGRAAEERHSSPRLLRPTASPPGSPGSAPARSPTPPPQRRRSDAAGTLSCPLGRSLGATTRGERARCGTCLRQNCCSPFCCAESGAASRSAPRVLPQPTVGRRLLAILAYLIVESELRPAPTIYLSQRALAAMARMRLRLCKRGRRGGAARRARVSRGHGHQPEQA